MTMSQRAKNNLGLLLFLLILLCLCFRAESQTVGRAVMEYGPPDIERMSPGKDFRCEKQMAGGEPKGPTRCFGHYELTLKPGAGTMRILHDPAD